MDATSSSSGAAQITVPQTTSKRVGPPYRRRAKNAVLNDPTLEQVFGSKEKALDAEEFPENSPLNLNDEEKAHWTRLREVLFDQDKADKATKNTNPRSYPSELAHVRQTLRMLQDVSAGTREQFAIRGHRPKQASRGSNTNTATTRKPKGITKAERTKSTKARDKRPSQQHGTDLAEPSSSAPTQEHDTDAMDSTPSGAGATPNSAEGVVFETSEGRTGNDEAMRKLAEDIREKHPAIRAMSPDTMIQIGDLAAMGLLQQSR